MPAAPVNMVIDQGDDFTAQILWIDAQGEPQKIAEPIRLDIKSGTKRIVSLTVEDVPDGEISPIIYSADIGVIQIHIPQSQTSILPPGLYEYDMFASVDDGDAYAGNQRQRILVGQIVVNKRITVV